MDCFQSKSFKNQCSFSTLLFHMPNNRTLQVCRDDEDGLEGSCLSRFFTKHHFVRKVCYRKQYQKELNLYWVWAITSLDNYGKRYRFILNEILTVYQLNICMEENFHTQKRFFWQEVLWFLLQVLGSTVNNWIMNNNNKILHFN